MFSGINHHILLWKRLTLEVFTGPPEPETRPRTRTGTVTRLMQSLPWWPDDEPCLFPSVATIRFHFYKHIKTQIKLRVPCCLTRTFIQNRLCIIFSWSWHHESNREHQKIKNLTCDTVPLLPSSSKPQLSFVSNFFRLFDFPRLTPSLRELGVFLCFHAVRISSAGIQASRTPCCQDPIGRNNSAALKKRWVIKPVSARAYWASDRSEHSSDS